MKIIIPMAGVGKRMRPHTLTVPKPLLKIAGKSIVERLVDNISTIDDIEEIHFIIGNFGEEVENTLKNLAASKGAKGYIHYQLEALGTAHAIYCASEALKGNAVIAFADTLFVGDFKIENDDEAIVWTKIVENPEEYGVVREDNNHLITDFIEKPKKFISNKAIIGIYYFKEVEKLRKEIEHLIDNNIKVGKEYQLTDALKNMLNKNILLKSKIIDEWLDCGNKEEYLKSCMRIVQLGDTGYNGKLSSGNEIIKPVFIGHNVIIKNSQIGPNVCIEGNTVISETSLQNTIIGENSKLLNCQIVNSIIGNDCILQNGKGEFNIGDFNFYEGI